MHPKFAEPHENKNHIDFDIDHDLFDHGGHFLCPERDVVAGDYFDRDNDRYLGNGTVDSLEEPITPQP